MISKLLLTALVFSFGAINLVCPAYADEHIADSYISDGLHLSDETDVCQYPAEADKKNTRSISLNWSVLIEDPGNALADDEKNELVTFLKQAAQNTHCNIGIIIDDTLDGEHPGQVANDFLDANFGYDSDSMVLLLTTDPDGFDYIAFSGAAYSKYNSKQPKIFEALYDGLSHGGYAKGIKGFCSFFGVETDDKTETDFLVKLIDEDNCLTDTEEELLLATMQVTADQIQCNVGVVITADLNGKSESLYADDFADSSFGYGSDNVVLLLCNDHIHTDWISAYGRGTDLFGNRIDAIFDRVYDGLDSSGYKKAIDSFCSALNYYGADAGDDFYYDYDDDYVYHRQKSIVELILEYIFGWRGIMTAIVLVFTIFNTKAIIRRYSQKKTISARRYMENERTNIYARTDNYIREFTTSHTINSSSGGGHSGGSRGGGGGRSRSGRSGGGGRRR